MASPRRVLADLKVFIRGYTRSKIGLFFSLVFPIILILLFGAIFSGGNGGPINVYVQNQDPGGAISERFVQALNNNSTTTVTLVNQGQNLSQYLLSHSANQGVLVPLSFTQDYGLNKTIYVVIYSNPADTSSPIVSQVVGGIITGLNTEGSPHRSIEIQQLSIKSQSYKYIDFLVPGLVGFSVLTSPMFALVNISSQYKRDKIFKQLSLTPLTKSEWLVSKIFFYIVLTIISFFLMTLVGVFAFGAHISLNPWIIPFIVLR